MATSSVSRAVQSLCNRPIPLFLRKSPSSEPLAVSIALQKAAQDIFKGLNDAAYRTVSLSLKGSALMTAVYETLTPDCPVNTRIRDYDIKIVLVEADHARVQAITRVIANVLKSYFPHEIAADAPNEAIFHECRQMPWIFPGRMTPCLYRIGPSDCPLEIVVSVYVNGDHIRELEKGGLYYPERLIVDLTKENPALRVEFQSSDREDLLYWKRELEGLKEADITVGEVKEVAALLMEITSLYGRGISAEQYRDIKKRAVDLLERGAVSNVLIEMKKGQFSSATHQSSENAVSRWLEKIADGWRDPLLTLEHVAYKNSERDRNLILELIAYISRKGIRGPHELAIHLNLQFLRTNHPDLRELQTSTYKRCRALLSEGLRAFLPADIVQPQALIWPLIFMSRSILVRYHRREIAIRLELLLEGKRHFVFIPFGMIPEQMEISSQEAYLLGESSFRSSLVRSDLVAKDVRKLVARLSRPESSFYFYLLSHKLKLPLSPERALAVLTRLAESSEYFAKAPQEAVHDVIKLLEKLKPEELPLTVMLSLLLRFSELPDSVLTDADWSKFIPVVDAAINQVEKPENLPNFPALQKALIHSISRIVTHCPEKARVLALLMTLDSRWQVLEEEELEKAFFKKPDITCLQRLTHHPEFLSRPRIAQWIERQAVRDLGAFLGLLTSVEGEGRKLLSVFYPSLKKALYSALDHEAHSLENIRLLLEFAAANLSREGSRALLIRLLQKEGCTEVLRKILTTYEFEISLLIEAFKEVSATLPKKKFDDLKTLLNLKERAAQNRDFNFLLIQCSLRLKDFAFLRLLIRDKGAAVRALEEPVFKHYDKEYWFFAVHILLFLGVDSERGKALLDRLLAVLLTEMRKQVGLGNREALKQTLGGISALCFQVPFEFLYRPFWQAVFTLIETQELAMHFDPWLPQFDARVFFSNLESSSRIIKVLSLPFPLQTQLLMEVMNDERLKPFLPCLLQVNLITADMLEGTFENAAVLAQKLIDSCTGEVETDLPKLRMAAFCGNHEALFAVRDRLIEFALPSENPLFTETVRITAVSYWRLLTPGNMKKLGEYLAPSRERMLTAVQWLLLKEPQLNIFRRWMAVMPTLDAEDIEKGVHLGFLGFLEMSEKNQAGNEGVFDQALEELLQLLRRLPSKRLLEQILYWNRTRAPYRSLGGQFVSQIIQTVSDLSRTVDDPFYFLTLFPRIYPFFVAEAEHLRSADCLELLQAVVKIGELASVKEGVEDPEIFDIGDFFDGLLRFLNRFEERIRINVLESLIRGMIAKEKLLKIHAYSLLLIVQYLNDSVVKLNISLMTDFWKRVLESKLYNDSSEFQEMMRKGLDKFLRAFFQVEYHKSHEPVVFLTSAAIKSALVPNYRLFSTLTCAVFRYFLYQKSLNKTSADLFVEWLERLPLEFIVQQKRTSMKVPEMAQIGIYAAYAYESLRQHLMRIETIVPEVKEKVRGKGEILVEYKAELQKVYGLHLPEQLLKIIIDTPKDPFEAERIHQYFNDHIQDFLNPSKRAAGGAGDSAAGCLVARID